MATAAFPAIFVNHKPGSDTFTIDCRYDKYLVSQIKKLEDAEWNGTNWEVPVYTKSMRLVNGEMKPTNQLIKVKKGCLTPHISHPVNFTEHA